MRFHLAFLLILTSLFTLISNGALSEDQRKRIRLGEATTVTFPSEPFTNSDHRSDQYGVNNENGLFQAVFLKSNLDAMIQHGSIEKIKEFYRGYLQGTTDKIQGEVVSIEYSKLKGYVFLDAKINYTETLTSEPKTLKLRAVTLMGRIYTLMFTQSQDKFPEYEPIGDEFLNSLTILANDKDEPLDPGGPLYDSEAKSTGEMLWRMFIGIFIIASIAIVAVYFATRKSKSERANQVKDL